MKSLLIILASSISLTAAQGPGDICYVDGVKTPSLLYSFIYINRANIFINLLDEWNMRVYYMVQ